MKSMFQGSIVALVTPFRDGAVDEATLRELVEFQVANGTDGVVPCGTTGESPTLSHEEHRRVVGIVVEAARGRLAGIAGTGSNSTRGAIEPKETAELTHAPLDGDWKRARELHWKLYPLARAVFIETNPIPIKEAMAMAGMIAPEFRLPLCRMADANRERLRAVLRQYGLA